MAYKYLLLTILLVGTAVAQTEIPEDLTLPPELQGKIDEKQLQAVQNKSTEQFKKKCEENGGPEAFVSAQDSFKNFTQCLGGLVDPAALQQEIEDAKPTGQVDEVFKKYCGKTPAFKGCFKDMTEAVKPCFSVDERKNLKTVYNISEQLAEFVCFKEGDRIALFIAEGGRECFQDKQPELEQCANSTLGTEYHFNPDELTPDNLPSITFGEKECTKMSLLQTCIVKVLETCEAPTTANIVESLFKFVRESTPCKDFAEKSGGKARSHTDPTAKKTNQKDSASGLAVTSLTLIMAAASLLL